MNYRFENKERFTVVGLKERMVGTVDSSENVNRMMEIWSSLTEEQTGEIMSLSNGYIDGLIGITANDDGKEFDYYIATTTYQTAAKNMSLLDVPASTWAVFDCVGALPNSIGETWKRVLLNGFLLPAMRMLMLHVWRFILMATQQQMITNVSFGFPL